MNVIVKKKTTKMIIMTACLSPDLLNEIAHFVNPAEETRFPSRSDLIRFSIRLFVLFLDRWYATREDPFEFSKFLNEKNKRIKEIIRERIQRGRFLSKFVTAINISPDLYQDIKYYVQKRIFLSQGDMIRQAVYYYLAEQYQNDEYRNARD